MLLSDRPRYTDRPFLHHDDILSADGRHGLFDCEVTSFDVIDLTLYIDRAKDPVLHGSFHNCSYYLSGFNYIANTDDGFELPFLLSVQSRCGDTTKDEISHFLLKNCQRPLNSVINGVQKSGAEFRNERTAGVRNRFSRFHAGRILINLDDRVVTNDLDDFAHQHLVSNVYDIVHTGRDTDSGNYRSCDSVNLSFITHLLILFV